MPNNSKTLNNGVEIPLIATGPGIIGYSPKNKMPKGRLSSLAHRVYKKFIGRPMQEREWIDALAYSFSIGYRLLDNSSTYRNWRQTTKAIKKSGLSREDIFITTRVDNRSQMNGEKAIREELEETLRLLNTDHVDLLQFHWPVTDHYIDTWLTMEKLYKEGKCRVLGVANCHQHHLEAIMEAGSVVPAIDQFEVHPLFTQKPLIEYCKSKGIQVQSYTPIARFDDRLMKLPVLKRIAAAHNKTIVQVILRWHIQCGLIPIIRSWNKSRLRENISIFDFELTSEEMQLIDAININARVRYDPDNCDFSIL